MGTQSRMAFYDWSRAACKDMKRVAIRKRDLASVRRFNRAGESTRRAGISTSLAGYQRFRLA